MTREEMIEGTIAEMEKYGSVSLGELERIKIREGFQWAADTWAKSVEFRGEPSAWDREPGSNYQIWLSIVGMAARHHPDWMVRDCKEGVAAFGPRKNAKERTKLALVAWFALNHTDLAFALQDEAANLIDA